MSNIKGPVSLLLVVFVTLGLNSVLLRDAVFIDVLDATELLIHLLYFIVMSDFDLVITNMC
jgi:hypothetical protein